MTCDDVRLTLAHTDPTRLSRLGFRDEDAAACRELIAALPQHPQRLERVAALAARLQERIGRFFDDNLPVRDDNGPASFDEGLDTLLALVAVASIRAEYHTERME